MFYENIREAVFIVRDNRFVARVLLADEEIAVHVPNTGRLREILRPGARVLLSKATRTDRKYNYTLYAVYKGSMLIHIDSAAANRLTEEAILAGRLPSLPPVNQLARERTYGHSRFDFSFVSDGRPAFLEVKGVTLERSGVARFPDAPTVRGRKHLQELMAARREGYLAYVLFVIQMQGPHCFQPCWDCDQDFCATLVEAADVGVQIMAYDSVVTPHEIHLHRKLPITLTHRQEERND